MRLIERVMAVRGITQTELANASGVNRVSVNRILRGKEQAGKKRKEAMALALGYSADYADELFRVEGEGGAMTINEDNVKLAPARECCDACGREMTPADYDAIHGTVLVSVTGKLGDVVMHGDSWTLMCPECYHAFQSMFADFKRRRAEL